MGVVKRLPDGYVDKRPSTGSSGASGPVNGGSDDGQASSGEGDGIMPLALAGGGGLLGYSLASSIFDDDDPSSRRKRSVWEKLLRALIPIGVGGLGAYAGHLIGKNMKTAQANAPSLPLVYGGERLWPMNRGGTTQIESVPEKYTNLFDSVSQEMTNRGHANYVPIAQGADDIASQKERASDWLRWGGQGVGYLGAAGLSIPGLFAIKPLDWERVPVVPEETMNAAKAMLAKRDRARGMTPAQYSRYQKDVGRDMQRLNQGAVPAGDVASVSRTVKNKRDAIEGYELAREEMPWWKRNFGRKTAIRNAEDIVRKDGLTKVRPSGFRNLGRAGKLFTAAGASALAGNLAGQKADDLGREAAELKQFSSDVSDRTANTKARMLDLLRRIAEHEDSQAGAQAAQAGSQAAK